jgi:hypothetical protein
VLAALAGSDRKAALALVTDLMSIAGTTNVGGRSVSEIADRFLEQSTLKGGALPRDALDTDQAIPRDRGRSRRGDRAIARAGRRRENSTFQPRSISSKAASASWPRAASIPADAVFHLVRARPRLLHRLRIRTAQPRAMASSRWWRAGAMTG